MNRKLSLEKKEPNLKPDLKESLEEGDGALLETSVVMKG